MYTHRLCAWRARSSAAARPPPFNRRCAALSSSSVASWIHCCKNVTARCAGSRFALRAQVVRRCAAPLRGAIARAVALALLARRFAARVPPSCSAVALLSWPAARGVGCAPLLRRPLPAARGAVGGAALLRRSSPLRGSSPGLAAVAARRRAPCPTSTSVLASLYPCQEST
jgi:hypothetical protein